MLTVKALPRVAWARGRQQHPDDPDAASLRRVGWRLAALTVSLIATLLLVLGIVVYTTMQSFLMQSLYSSVRQQTAVVLPHAAPVGSRPIGQGGQGGPVGPGGPGGPNGRVPTFLGDVHFAVADRTLTVIRTGDPDAPTALPDLAAARQVIGGHADKTWTEQQVDSHGPYLIYTCLFSFVQPNGATVTRVLQAYISEQQYRGGLQTLLDILVGVSVVGLLAATAISAVLARRALDPIQRALRRQRDFVADAAHELRTPLAIQRTAMELGLASDIMTEQQGAIEESLSQNMHLTRLVDNLSLLARADSGAVTLEHQPVDLAQLTRETVGGVAILAEERGVRLEVEAPDEMTVMGDAGRLRQVLLILLDNALKYTPDAGAIAVRLARHGSQARLQVRDTGPGIAPNELPHLFERFYRADKARSSTGTGLGLSIGLWIAEAHGGRIMAANAPDGGALFSVTLPLASA